MDSEDRYTWGMHDIDDPDILMAADAADRQQTRDLYELAQRFLDILEMMGRRRANTLEKLSKPGTHKRIKRAKRVKGRRRTK